MTCGRVRHRICRAICAKLFIKTDKRAKINTKDKIVRETKRLSDTIFGTKFNINPTNKITKTALVKKGAALLCNVTIGEFSHINQGVYLYSDAEIGNCCSIVLYSIIGPYEHDIETFSTFAFHRNKAYKNKEAAPPSLKTVIEQ